MTNQNTLTCTKHGTVLDSYYVAAEPHPMGGIVPAHEELTCQDCQLNYKSKWELANIEPSSNRMAEGQRINNQRVKVPSGWVLYLILDTVPTAPKIKQYAEGVIGSRFVSTKTRSMGYAVSVLDHHYLADHYGSLPIVRESEIEDLLGYHGGELTEAQDVIEFGFIADDWAEIDILKNKEISKDAGIRFDSNK